MPGVPHAALRVYRALCASTGAGALEWQLQHTEPLNQPRAPILPYGRSVPGAVGEGKELHLTHRTEEQDTT